MSTVRTNEIKMLDDRGAGSFTFDSVADLQAANQLTVGQKVRTLGYYAPGDGGGNDYEIVAAGTGSNYGFLYEQLTGSRLEAKLLGGGVMEDKTVYIPTDYGTLQEALDDLSTLSAKQGVTIDLVIEAGHQPESGISVSDGDYSRFRISSVDAEVTLGPAFPALDVIRGVKARMPILNCLINANSLGLNGYFADQGSSGFVTPGSGIKYCNQQACYANAGSSISADGTIWTFASQGAASYSGILAWASTISAQGADASNSNYYGAQAAASGTLNFRNGTADGAARHGVRATNGALVNARGASSNNTGDTGFRAFDTGIIHATDSTATGSLGNAYQAQNNGIITADNVTADAVTSALVALEGGKILSKNSTFTNGSIRAEDCGYITLVNPSITHNGRTLTAAFGSTIVCRGGSVSGGDGQRALNVSGGSYIHCENTNLTAASGEAYLATVYDASTLNIIRGTHTYPNGAVNLLNGSYLNLTGSGISAVDVPSMQNITLSGRGLMFGAS